MPKLFRPLLCSFMFALGLGCAEVEEGELDDDLAQTQQALTGVGGPRTHMANLGGAENQTYTTDGRLFVTGDEGIIELRQNADKTFTRTPRFAATGCQFGGITQSRGVIYANCYNFSQSFLYAARLTASPVFTRIATLATTPLANGLAADKEGRLYIAATGQNEILRFFPSATDPLVISKSEIWHRDAGRLTNGLKYHNNTIYWSDSFIIRSVVVNADGSRGTQKDLVVGLNYYDDLSVDAEGILAADFGNGVIRSFKLDGTPTAASMVKFNGPSSVSRALGRAGMSQGALVITERNANKVTLWEPVF